MEQATTNDYPETPMEEEEVAYTCQGCGEVSAAIITSAGRAAPNVLYRFSRKGKHSNFVSCSLSLYHNPMTRIRTSRVQLVGKSSDGSILRMLRRKSAGARLL